MTENSGQSRRWLSVLPILSAIAYHGLALDRGLVASTVGVALAAIAVFQVSVSSSAGRWSIAAGVGLLVGLVMPVGNVAPSSPLSPAVLSVVSGMLISVAVLSVLVGRVTVGWISAWLLVAVSGHVEMRAVVAISLIAFIAASLVGAASLAGVFHAGRRCVLPLGLFVAMVTITTYAIASGAKQLDGVMLSTLEALFVTSPTTGTSGIGSEITLNARSSVKLSQQSVLDLSAMPGLLRTRVMDEFDGRQWTTSSELRSTSHAVTDIPVRTATRRQLEMIPLDDLHGLLPSPAGTREIQGARARFAGGWVLWGDPESAELTLVGDRMERLPAELEPGPRYLFVPEELRLKLTPLAEQLTSADLTTREQIEQLERFFQRNFEYSLETDLSGPEHPLVTMVQERRPAYCVYFASAMAAMLRCQGNPARIVSGYAPVELNRVTGRVTIRQRDAHAWVEAWIADEGRFVAFDPTPSGSREQVIGQAERAGWISDIWDALRSGVRRAWLLVRYDPAGSLMRFVKSPLSWLLLLALVFCVGRYRRDKQVSHVASFRIKSTDPVLRQIYDRYIRSLRSFGVEPHPWETDDELLIRLSLAMDAATVAIADEFLARYRQARFRGEPVDDQLMELAKLGISNKR